MLLGAAIAVALMADGNSKNPPHASRYGLVVEVGREDDGKLDPARPLRCFVGGTFVGEITLAECALKNGVATGALDVGVDDTGALVAADEAGSVLTPLPPVPESEVPLAPGAAQDSVPVIASIPAVASVPAAACWRYQGVEWRRIGEMSLNTCLQTLFAGRCERPGGAIYGRWGEQALRMVLGRVETSIDNRSFQPLVEQSPTCVIPRVG